VIAPIVQGQIRSYLNDHGRQLLSAKHGMDRDTIIQSLSKRIINDLLCAGTRARLRQAILASCGMAERSAPVLGTVPTPWAQLAARWLRPPSPPLQQEQTGET
jgi:hypothetical protein